MLDKFDDFPIHQTPEPIAHPATSDKNFYDRTFFNGYSADGSYYFGIGIAIYPHRGLMDCSFSVLTAEGQQYSFHGSRSLPRERSESVVGPFRLEILKPMRKTRIVLDDNPSGLTCDIEFNANTAAIEEDRQVLHTGPRKVMDATRFAQFGSWQGQVTSPSGTLKLDAQTAMGVKDRSWGIRPMGDQDRARPSKLSTFHFLWAPLIWEEHVSHAVIMEGGTGTRPAAHEALFAPLYAEPEQIPGTEDDGVQRADSVRYRVEYKKGTRHIARAELDLINADESIRTLQLEPLMQFQMKGLGYQHPEFRQGWWQGELAIRHESFNVQELDPLDPANIHVQQLVRAVEGDSVGYGALEYNLLGPYPSAGFTEALDGAR